MINQQQSPELNEGDIIRITDAGISEDLAEGDIASVKSVEQLEPFNVDVDTGSEDEEKMTIGEEYTRATLKTAHTTTSTDISLINWELLSDELLTSKVATDNVFDAIRDDIGDECRFTVTHPPDDIFTLLNKDRDDEHQISGKIRGTTDDEIVIHTEDGYRHFSEEVWIENYGAEEVEVVWVENGNNNLSTPIDTDTIIKAQLFSVQNLKRKVFTWVKENLPFALYTKALNTSQEDPNVWFRLYCEYNTTFDVTLPDSGEPHRYTGE